MHVRDGPSQGDFRRRASPAGSPAPADNLAVVIEAFQRFDLRRVQLRRAVPGYPGQLIESDESGAGYKLIMIEGRPWSDAPEQLVQLREKINNYAMFVLDEGLLRAYPEWRR